MADLDITDVASRAQATPRRMAAREIAELGKAYAAALLDVERLQRELRAATRLAETTVEGAAKVREELEQRRIALFMSDKEGDRQRASAVQAKAVLEVVTGRFHALAAWQRTAVPVIEAAKVCAVNPFSGGARDALREALKVHVGES